MNTIRNHMNTLVIWDIMFIVMLYVSSFLLGTIVLEGNFAPILLYTVMIVIGIALIIFFSNRYEIFFKTKLFIFFFSFYLFYIMMHDYILLNLFPHFPPFDYFDERTFYHYSDLALFYILKGKNFFDLFSDWNLPFRDLPLHAVFSALIAYFSMLVDGKNTIMVQKMLSPFFGGLLLVVLYSTIKYQFKDRDFALHATFVYGTLSAVFMYSTPLLRDIDIALAYMIFFFLFLHKNSFINFILLFLIAFLTMYLRIESGMVLFAFILLYSYLYVKELQSRSMKWMFYVLLMILFSFVILLMFNKIIGMIIHLNEANITRSIASASSSSIGVLLNKLPFPLSYIAKVTFGQMQPFPFFLAIDRPPEAISGIFWPFIFIMMSYAVMKKNIRVLIDTKVKYLLMFAITILFLMSSEPMARRMMSVYPIIYIVALHTFFYVDKNNIKKSLLYYIFVIIALNTFYYLLKV